MTLGRIGQASWRVLAIADAGRSLLLVVAKWLLIHAIRGRPAPLRDRAVDLEERRLAPVREARGFGA
jgi:hypothetical protein